METPYLTVDETAAIFGVHPETVRVWLREGRIPGRKLGKSWYILKSDVVPEKAPVDQTDP